MANEIGFPHASVQLIDANGRMTREGHQFLFALWRRVPISGYALQTDMDAAEAAIDAAEASIVTAQADIDAAEADIATIEATLTARNHYKVQLSCSDLTTALTTGTNVGYFRATRAFTLTAVRASLLTASTSGAVTIDINVNGTTILSTKLTIDQDEKTSTTAATPAVISSASIADDDEVSIDIDGAGSGAAGLVVALIGTLA